MNASSDAPEQKIGTAASKGALEEKVQVSSLSGGGETQEKHTRTGASCPTLLTGGIQVFVIKNKSHKHANKPRKGKPGGLCSETRMLHCTERTLVRGGEGGGVAWDRKTSLGPHGSNSPPRPLRPLG